MNKQPCLPCKTNKWRNKLPASLHNWETFCTWEVLQGSCVVLQEGLHQELSQLPCSRGAGAESTLLSWDAPRCPCPAPGSWQPQHWGSLWWQRWEHPWVRLVPLAGEQGAYTSPQWGAWGTEERAQGLPRPSCSYPGHEQICSQGDAENSAGSWIFSLFKGIFFSISFPLNFFNHLSMPGWIFFNPFGEHRTGLKLPLFAGTRLPAAGAASPVCRRGFQEPRAANSSLQADQRHISPVSLPNAWHLHQGVYYQRSPPRPLQPASSESLVGNCNRVWLISISWSVLFYLPAQAWMQE